jgi:alkylation response protein AidB-like acyl-CoA dehydrogenase
MEPKLQIFEREARAFLESHAKPLPPSDVVWGQGSDRVTSGEQLSDAEERAWLEAAQAWRALEYDNGFGWITGPVEYGGRELAVEDERCYRDVRAGFDVPATTPFTISLGMVAPTILAHGTDQVREGYLRPLYRGEMIGCQLFSEPGTGSDLTGVSAKAVRDGDDWVVSGQKVWTSGAHFSQIGEILCRTNPAAPKHKGLSAFIVDMGAPGVEVRPLRQMNGRSDFNEVFFSDVRIPDSHRLGEINDGWRVAMTTLMSERALGAGPGVFGIERAIEMLVLLARHSGAGDDPVIRQALARCFASAKTVKYNGLRADARRRAGRPPGPEESIFKLSSTNVLGKVAEAASLILGPKLMADSGDWGTFSWSDLVLQVPGARIAAGTDEIMRNILAERVLGLPKEPSVWDCRSRATGLRPGGLPVALSQDPLEEFACRQAR